MTETKAATAAKPVLSRNVPHGRAPIGEVERKLSFGERLAGNAAFRRVMVLVVLCVIWEIYGRILNNSLILPTFLQTIDAFWTATIDGPLPERVASSLYVLLIGYTAGTVLAGLFTAFAIGSRIGADVLSTLTAMFNPLPAIALLPLALLWFGLGVPSLVFVIIHSVLWAVSLNTLTGFMTVPDVQRMAGQNYGLRGLRFVLLILIPAAFPSILAGLKIGWAFAWRTLIAAELVFGVSSRSGGLGWFIYENRAELETASVFAGLLTVIIIGLVVDNVLFRVIEAQTVRKWGVQR
ncbi:MAG: ABC transporter permease subunit [Rhodomicrobium sp.]|nr:ABC transporter permease subunit [Rhodomicrobium sp.]